MLRFWRKKHGAPAADSRPPVKYTKRKKVADKKLRVNGKFVSKKQAVSLLGMSKRQIERQLKKQAKMAGAKPGKRTTKIDAKVSWNTGGEGPPTKEITLSNAQQLLKAKPKTKPLTKTSLNSHCIRK